MTARDEILGKVREGLPPFTPLPDVRAAAHSFANPAVNQAGRFIEAARASGARVTESTRDDLASLIPELYPDARAVLSSSPSVAGTMVFSEDPHALGDTDLFVCEATLGVAENGAVWIPASRVRHRAALFLAANVAILVERYVLVHDLHAAYAAIDVAVDGFGVFVAGPSKTADIEQALVIGAHGPKSLSIILLT